MADHFGAVNHSQHVSQAGRANVDPGTTDAAPAPQKSPKGARQAAIRPQPVNGVPDAKDGGQALGANQFATAPMIDEPGQENVETHAPDARFIDPLIQQIVQQWRIRQDFVRAQTRLTNQARAILRRLCGGDKDEAEKLWKAIQKGKPHPLAEIGEMAVTPLMVAQEPLLAARKGYEKAVAKLAKRLPIAEYAAQIDGLGMLGLGAIVGECGDLSAYKSVSAVWKRCGLAVIEGGRQRRVSGEAAFLHGYDGERRSVLWNRADPLFKRQSVVDGPYRAVYDDAKAAKLAQEWTAAHAHNHALRLMTKRLLRDLTVAWRDVAAITQTETMRRLPPHLPIAAE